MTNMAIQYAIQSPKGNIGFIRKSPSESKEAFIDSRYCTFEMSWDNRYAAGYRCIKIDLKIIPTWQDVR